MHDRKFRKPENTGAVPGNAARAFTLKDLRSFARLRFWTILLPVLVAVAAAFGYMQIAIPTYTARAQIIIEARLPQFIPGRNQEGLLAWDSAQVESEIAVLQSERIASAVVSKLGLDKANDFRATPSLAGRLRALVARGTRPAVPETDRFRDALDLIQTGLSIRRTGLSYAIDISFVFPDPVRSMEIANSVADAYIADQIENRSQAARVGGEWLQQRMVSLKAQMNAASRAVQIFRAGHNYAIVQPEPEDAGPPGTKNPQASAAQAPREDKTLDELEASASTYRRIYESFLQSYTESVQRQSFPVSDARILTTASLPKVQSAPRGVLIYALALLVGTLVGLALALLQHHFDQTIRSAGEVAEASGLDELGSLPRLRTGRFSGLRAWARRRARPRPPAGGAGTGYRIREQLASGGPKRRGALARYVPATPNERSPQFLTALRTVKVLTELQGRQRPLRTIGITAAHHGGGSSTLVAHLGTLSADCGSRVLIVDADLAEGGLTRQLGQPRRPGLAEVLSGAAPFGEAVVSFEGTSLDFLGAQAIPGADRACAVTAEAMDAFLDRIAPDYDLVLVDLPPVLPADEVVAIGAVLSGTILVVEWGRTSAGAVAASAAYLDRAQARTLGFVLSKTAL